MDKISKFNVVHQFEKRSLLIAVNCVAGLSVFFFGYDQGVMGGVNTARDYASTMGFGHWNPAQGIVVVDDPLLQGGIVCISVQIQVDISDNARSLSTTCQALSLVLSLVAGSVIGLAASRLLGSLLHGLWLALLFNVLPRTQTGCSAVFILSVLHRISIRS